MLFRDRADAGRQLIKALLAYENSPDAVVLGLARGGVVVAHEIAKALHLPLGVIVVRKIGAPGNEELALGAVSASGEALFNEELIQMLGISPQYLAQERERQRQIAAERVQRYQGKSPVSLEGKTVILVDDGIATGASMRVAIHSARAQKAKKIVLAVPVAPPDILQEMRAEVDEAVCLATPALFSAVGMFYYNFDQVLDEGVAGLLA